MYGEAETRWFHVLCQSTFVTQRKFGIKKLWPRVIHVSIASACGKYNKLSSIHVSDGLHVERRSNGTRSAHIRRYLLRAYPMVHIMRISDGT